MCLGCVAARKIRLTASRIRYAQSTGGKNRWQAPRAPETNRSEVIDASKYGASCPQAPDASSTFTAVDNSRSSEDCLFLNVRRRFDL